MGKRRAIWGRRGPEQEKAAAGVSRSVNEPFDNNSSKEGSSA
jgi:hypothetical protein